MRRVPALKSNASSRTEDDSRLWRAQKERQQRIAREAGRIGYIGNAGPALGSTVLRPIFNERSLRT